MRGAIGARREALGDPDVGLASILRASSSAQRPAPSAPPFMRLLIVRLSAMGDIVHTLPLAANARRAGAEVGWLVEKSHAELIQGNPAIQRLFLAKTRSWRRKPLTSSTRGDLETLSGELTAFRPDFVIEAHGLWKSILVARLARAPIVSLARRDRREPSSSLPVDHRVRLDPGAGHVRAPNLQLPAPSAPPLVDS